MHIMTLFTPLHNPTYRRLFAAHVLALTATGLLNVGLGLRAFDVSPHSAGTVVASLLVIKIVIYVVASPWLVRVFSRWDARRVLVGSDVVRIGVGVSLPFISARWELFVAVAVLQLAAATFTPTFQALIPRVVVDEDDYARALSLSRIAYDLEQILSPVVAALLLSWASQSWVFGVAAVGFVGSGLLVGGSGCGGVGKRGGRRSGGVGLMLGCRELRGVLALNLVLAAPTALVLVNSVVLVRGVLGRPESDVAVLLGACGVGSMAAALVIPRLRVEAALFGGATGAIVSLLAFFLLIDAFPHWPAFIALWFGLGASMSALATPMGQVIRRNVGDQDLPAVFAAQFSLSHACYLVAYPLAGWCGARLGLGWTALLLALIAGFALVVAANMWPVRRRANLAYTSEL